MRSHGWSGNAPSSDEEAINRILDAAEQIIEQRGSAMRIADVARDLGVTRQTVYRYFPGTDALILAAAMRSADGFLNQLKKHLKGETNAVAAVIEGMAFAVEQLAHDTRVGFVLNQRPRSQKPASITSDTALTFSRSMLHTLDVDWLASGFDDEALDELAEFCMRTMHSFLADPDHPKRNPTELRRYLTRWIGPAIAFPHLTVGMDALRRAQTTSPTRRKRRPTAS